MRTRKQEAKVAIIWILGEYAEHITEVADHLENHVKDFEKDSSEVQIHLVNACVKTW